MESETTFKLDAIDELRYRRWAPQNYVPPTKRIESWHPIIIDEMRHKDAELAVSIRVDQSQRPLDPHAFAPTFVMPEMTPPAAHSQIDAMR